MIPGIFDPNITPNQRYEDSPLLFWSMVCTGARRYMRNPIVYQRLSERMNELVFSSLSCNTGMTSVLQALLIICSWPMPRRTPYGDPSQALAGAGMYMAIQNGLHISCREEDFAIQPTKRPQSSMRRCKNQKYHSMRPLDSEASFRARLWVNCLIVFQR